MVPEPYASMYDPDEITVPEHCEGEFNDQPPYFKLAQQKNPDFSAFQEPEGNSIHGGGSHLKSHDVKSNLIYARNKFAADFFAARRSCSNYRKTPARRKMR